MTIADIIAEFGAYYINQGQNATRLVQLLYRPAVTDQLFRSIVTDDTVYRASQTRLGRILQPFQKGWTPVGTMSATPIEIPQFKMKADLQETPDDLEATWLGFLADDSLDRKTWPFVRWFIEVHCLPQIQEDYELYEVYGGQLCVRPDQRRAWPRRHGHGRHSQNHAQRPGDGWPHHAHQPWVRYSERPGRRSWTTWKLFTATASMRRYRRCADEHRHERNPGPAATRVASGLKYGKRLYACSQRQWCRTVQPAAGSRAIKVEETQATRL